MCNHNKSLQKANTKYWIIAAKALMLILLCWAIYWQLFNNNRSDLIGDIINKQFQAEHWLYSLIAIVLIILNFGCETKKWLTLTNFFYKLSFKKAYKAVLAGTTMAFFTPNRIGEYGGRILFVPQKYMVETVAITMVSGLAQQLITLLFGLCSLFILKDVLLEKSIFSETQYGIIAFITWVLTIALFFIYFNVKHAINFIPKIKLLKKHLAKLVVLQRYSKITLLKVMLWAGLKYLVFSTQFFCLIIAFGVPFQYWFIWLSMLSFLLQTLIPSVSLFELGVRGNVVLFTFAAFTHLKIEILAASVTLWIFNLLIPAIIGAFFILKINLDN